jgi:hypothetical protein
MKAVTSSNVRRTRAPPGALASTPIGSNLNTPIESPPGVLFNFRFSADSLRHAHRSSPAGRLNGTYLASQEPPTEAILGANN